MNLNGLKQAAAKAQQAFRIAELKVADLQRTFKAAKAKTEQARLEHKRVRKAAKQAKKLTLAAEDQARERRRICEKAQKRLAKSLKKLAKVKGGGAKKTPKAVAAPLKPASARQAAKTKLPPIPRKTPVVSQSPPTAPGAVTGPPASPTV